MGAFKPLLPFGNKTVIECCIDYLRDGGVEEIVVVLGHRADEIRRKVSNVRFAHNPDPDSEMGASIAAGVGELPDDRSSNADRTRRSPRNPRHSRLNAPRIMEKRRSSGHTNLARPRRSPGAGRSQFQG